MLRLKAEILKTFEIESVEDNNSKWLRFRVELVRESSEKIRVKLWRVEFFRIQPTFPQNDGLPAHESSDELIVVDDSDLLDHLTFSKDTDFQHIVEQVVKTLNQRFGFTSSRNRCQDTTKKHRLSKKKRR